MKFTLTIESSNAAVVGEGAEIVIANMLGTAALQVRDGNTSGYLRDGYSNGPAIGYWEYTPEADDLEGTTSDDEDEESERTVFVRWDTTETYTANIPVPDDVTDIGEWLESEADSTLAEAETTRNYQGTPDRVVAEWEE